MLSIAGIVLGFGLLLEASIIAAEYGTIRARPPNSTFGGLLFGGGLGVQTLAGIAVIVLGILAFAPMFLALITMLVIGVAELFSGTAVGGRVA